MSLLDLAILLIVLFFSFQGFRNGLVREILTLAGLLAALFVALHYMAPLSLWLLKFVELSVELVSILSATILFSLVFTIALIFAYLIQKFLEVIHLNLINRLFGLFFGGLKSAIVISLLLIFMAGMNIPDQEIRQESLIYSYILRLAPMVFEKLEHRIPEELPEMLSYLWHTIENTTMIMVF